MNRSPVAPAALFALNLLVWGYNWVPLQLMLADAAPASASAIRVLGGALVLFLVLAMMRRPLAPPRDPAFILIGLVQIGGMVGFSTLAVLYGGVGRSAILVFTMPFWTIVLARVVLREHVGIRRWFALAVAIAGIGLIASDSLGHPREIVGALYAFAAGFAWALGSIVTRLRPPLDLVRSAAWQQFVGGLPLLAIALILHDRAPVMTPAFLVAAAFTAVIGSGLGWLLWAASVKAIAPPTLALGSLAIPIVASLAAFVQLHERPDGLTLTGLGIVLAALIVANLPLASLRRPVVLQAGR